MNPIPDSHGHKINVLVHFRLFDPEVLLIGNSEPPFLTLSRQATELGSKPLGRSGIEKRGIHFLGVQRHPMS